MCSVSDPAVAAALSTLHLDSPVTETVASNNHNQNAGADHSSITSIDLPLEHTGKLQEVADGSKPSPRFSVTPAESRDTSQPQTLDVNLKSSHLAAAEVNSSSSSSRGGMVRFFAP